MAARILNNVSVTLLNQTFYRLLLRLARHLKPRQVLQEDDAEREHLRRLMQALETAAGGETAEANGVTE